MDGKVFDMKDYEAGSTAPPFHVNCRSTTAPYFDDMNGLGERFARDAAGKTYTVPKDMTYSEWKNTYVDNSNNGGIIKSVTIDDVKALAKEGTVSAECIDEIANALGDDAKYFDSVRLISSGRNADGTIDLLRTNVEQKGTWAETVLEINEDVFKGKTLDEVNERISNSHNNGHCVMKNLQEAVWHEAGHAKLMYGESYARANSITDTLNDYHISGISKIGYINGDECLAECYILKRRGEEIPEQAKDLWNEFMKE